jgi:GH15 family glucan-1,4-alpha-glucosidase
MKSHPKIQDYALIGDGRSSALVSRGGSIDWLCWPRFDSPSLFASLLDHHAGGCWSIAPTTLSRVTRSYVEDSNVLRTRFTTPTGGFTVIDFMPALAEADKHTLLLPEHELIRRVEGEEGECQATIHFAPRPGYGRAKAFARDAGRLGIRIEADPGLFTLRTDAELRRCGALDWSTTIPVPAGKSFDFSLSCAIEGPAVLPPLGEVVSSKLNLTVGWWRDWASRTKYNGPYRDAVVRSALALKALSYAPSGAIVAAATTSLPERVGADRNWDYRFCWLRDAAFTARALFGLGYKADGEAFVSWLLHATRLTRPELKVVYDVFGNRAPRETELAHFQGYRQSRPVRIGNAAREQLQLDVYGEAIEAVTHLLRHATRLDRETQKMLRQFGKYVCRHGREPDNGIWESRSPRKHYTHSRLMCWVALDRLLKMHAQGQLCRIPAEEFEKRRDELRQDIESQGWDSQLDSYVQAFGLQTLDATALLLGLHGFHDPAAERLQKTLQCVCARLGAGPGLVFRNEQGIKVGEGAFAMCGFWLAEFLARGGGTLDEAHEVFAENLRYANDLGLYGEEIDPTTADALGNFPQAFTHIGLINAALSLAEQERQRRRLERPTHELTVGGPL